jgi:hypothetical protein
MSLKLCGQLVRGSARSVAETYHHHCCEDGESACRIGLAISADDHATLAPLPNRMLHCTPNVE